VVADRAGDVAVVLQALHQAREGALRGAESNYLTAMLPTFLLSGIGFTLAFGPLTIAATSDVGNEEQGLASGLVYTSFQLGGAVGLAIATAVIDAGTAGSSAPSGSAQALLDGFQPGILVSIAIAALGAAVTLVPLITRRTGARVFRGEAEEQPVS
jgi:MFS family permease